MKIVKKLLFAVAAICFFGNANAQVVVKARIGAPRPHRVVVVRHPIHREVVVVQHPVHREVVVVHHPVHRRVVVVRH